MFYGDSITESWRGLQVGAPAEKFKGIPEVFAKLYGSVKAAAYSIAGMPSFHFKLRAEGTLGSEADFWPGADWQVTRRNTSTGGS